MVVTGRADHPCRTPIVAAVDDTAQSVVVPEEGVGFIDEDGGVPFLNRPEHRRRRDVARRQWARHQCAKQCQQGRFPALRRRTGYGQDWGDRGSVVGVGMHDPKRDRFGRPRRQDQVVSRRLCQRGQEIGTLNQLRPRLGIVESNGRAASVTEVPSAANSLYLRVEGGDTDAEMPGLGLTATIIFDGR